MKKVKKIFFIILILSSCSSVDNNKIKELEEQKDLYKRNWNDCTDAMKAQSEDFNIVGKEICRIITNLDSADQFQNSLEENGTTSKKNALIKLEKIKYYLSVSKIALESLNDSLTHSKIAINSLKSTIIKLECEVKLKEKLIDNIKAEIIKSNSETVNLIKTTKYESVKELTQETKEQLKKEYDNSLMIVKSQLEKEYSKNLYDTISSYTAKLNEISKKNEDTIMYYNDKLITLNTTLELSKAKSVQEKINIYENAGDKASNYAALINDFIFPNKKKITFLRYAVMYYNAAKQLGKDCDNKIQDLMKKYPNHFKKISLSE